MNATFPAACPARMLPGSPQQPHDFRVVVWKNYRDDNTTGTAADGFYCVHCLMQVDAYGNIFRPARFEKAREGAGS